MKNLKLAKLSQLSLSAPGKARGPLPKQDNANLLIFRHCETYDNRRRIFSGRRDSRLTDIGKKQAESLAIKLKHFEIKKIYLPNLIRCRMTVAALLKQKRRVEIKLCQSLLERDYGKLTGKSKLKAARDFGEKALEWRRGYYAGPPGGESLKMVEIRVLPFCRSLEKEQKEMTSGMVAVCATNNTMRLMRKYFEKLTVRQMQGLENPFGDYVAYRV